MLFYESLSQLFTLSCIVIDEIAEFFFLRSDVFHQFLDLSIHGVVLELSLIHI